MKLEPSGRICWFRLSCFFFPFCALNCFHVRSDLEKGLLKALKKLDDYLGTPLPDEIDANSADEVTSSSRPFLDGRELTLADCNLLPKLHIVKVNLYASPPPPLTLWSWHFNSSSSSSQVVCLKYRNFTIPESLTNVWRYLNAAYAKEEFSATCPVDDEIHMAYSSVAKALK